MGPAAAGGAGLKIAGFGLLFRTAGSGIDIERDSSGIISVLRRRYTAFSASGRGGLLFDVSPAAGRQSPFRPEVSLRGGRLALGRGDFRAYADLRKKRGTLEAAPNEQCLDAFLRSLLSSLLARSGGLMLHSAGIFKGGKAYLFLGKSGAGKSTLAKLAAASRCAEVVSDEINLLKFENGRFMVYGSPFWGEMRSEGRQGRWPLGGIFLLRKGAVNRVSGCPLPEAVRLLLRCAVNFDKSHAAAAVIMANAARLAAKAHFDRLEFSKKDASFLELIRYES
jgi:hypothetical protein